MLYQFGMTYTFLTLFLAIMEKKYLIYVGIWPKIPKKIILYFVTCVTFKPKNHRNATWNINKHVCKISAKSKGSW